MKLFGFQAKYALRRKQTLGRMLAKRETALETIHNMLQQIHDAESHGKVSLLSPGTSVIWSMLCKIGTSLALCGRSSVISGE